MLEIKIIDEARRADINLPNEPFELSGRMIPSYCDGHWSCNFVSLAPEEASEMCFPDENYDYDAMTGEKNIFLGAYDGESCCGLAILQPGFFRYMYLYDLKVCRNYRRRHIGTLLIGKAKEVATGLGYRGLYTQAQDNNPGACRFYLREGFYIGGIDTNVYKWTSQEGKTDIIFYLDC